MAVQNPLVQSSFSPTLYTPPSAQAEGNLVPYLSISFSRTAHTLSSSFTAQAGALPVFILSSMDLPPRPITAVCRCMQGCLRLHRGYVRSRSQTRLTPGILPVPADPPAF